MIGDRIAHYTITGKLGEGGMGVVYKADDARLGRSVALKFLSSDLSGFPSEHERFIREARAASALNNPNICTIHDIGEHDGRTFIVMEFIDGTPLSAVAGTLTEKEALALLRQAANGLAAAHDKGIVHRDIKSSNIMRTGDGLVKLMDFGLATTPERPDVTTEGSTVGTMAYLPPEQARGEQVDHRADIYALGVVLYELLTGRKPFDAAYQHALLYQILNERPPAPSSIRPGITRTTEAIIDRCMARDRADRYATTRELIADLDGIVEGRPVTASPAPDRPASAGRWWPVAAIVAVAAAIVMLAGPTDVWEAFTRWMGAATAPDEQHLAVLPFANIGGDPDQQGLCDGLTETMTSQLTQLERFHGSLWVVPASDVRHIGVRSADDARAAFGVNSVLDGSLQKINGRYRLTLNLVDARTLRQTRSASIDLDQQKVAALQDEAVMRVLDMLHLELHPETRGLLQSGGTGVPAAYEHYLRGRGALLRYEKEENIDEAILAFRQAVRADSGFALAYAALGEALWRKYEFGKDPRWVPEAIANCERAMALGKDRSAVNVTLGIVYAGTGKPGKAIDLFQTALALDPANAEAYRGLARAHEAMGSYELAEQTYKRAVALRPTYWGSHNDLGVFYNRNNRYTDAIGSFRKVTELTPNNYRGFNNLGGVYYMLDRKSEARESFKRSYAIRPTYRTASNIGTLLYAEGKLSEAAQWYEKALAHNANDHVVVGNLASAYYWVGDTAKARDAFARAVGLAMQQLSVNPRDGELLALIAGYHAMLGQATEARRFVDLSLRESPKDASVMFRAGTTFERVGERDKALVWIGHAIAAGYSLGEIANQPELRELYADPRYAALTAEHRK